MTTFQNGGPDKKEALSRRSLIKGGATLAAGATLAGMVPQVHAAGDSTIRLALIGCGGRGSGAVGDAFRAEGGPIQLYAMADIFQDRLDRSHKALQGRFPDKVDVPKDRQFIGFDAYKKAIDSLRPGDVAMLTAYSSSRPVHLDYAVQKGVHVFMEKSLAADPGGSKRMLVAGQEADKKNLKIGVGLMCRHSTSRQAMIEKIREGALGEIAYIRAQRLQGARRLTERCPAGESLVNWQLRNKWHFMWTSSGQFIEWCIHQIDEVCWLKDAWPVTARGLGGRMPTAIDLGQDLDTYNVEFIFPDGTYAHVDHRFNNGCYNDFTTTCFGEKKAGHFSGPGHRANSAIFKSHKIDRNNIEWEAPPDAVGFYQAEWSKLLTSIRDDQPYNETQRGVYSNIAAIMGRAACHTGREVKWDDVANSDFVFCDYLDTLDADSPAPVMPDETGQYPLPIPGQWKEL